MTGCIMNSNIIIGENLLSNGRPWAYQMYFFAKVMPFHFQIGYELTCSLY